MKEEKESHGQEGCVFREVSANEMRKMIEDCVVDFSKNPRSREVNVSKHFDDPLMRYSVLVNEDGCSAVACWRRERDGCVYLASIVSFSKGCGKEMIDHLLDHVQGRCFYLLCDPSERSGKLKKWYRSLGLFNEVKKGSTSWFYKNKRLTDEEMEELISRSFFRY